MSETPASAAPGAFCFATKATTLERLAPHVTRARLCDQICVAIDRWKRDREAVTGEILRRFGSAELAVRSSAAGEDGWDMSHAGAHLSLVDVAPGKEILCAAIDDVFMSYRSPSSDDQVLVQPMVRDVVISGVVLTRDLDTGSPYYVINYDDFSGRTDTVTGGADSKTIFVHRSRSDALRSPRFSNLIQAAIELEKITGSHELDIEFCITAEDTVYLLQVRPLAARQRWQAIADSDIDAALDHIRDSISRRLVPAPGLAGATTVLAEMSDWNPAEMIGNTPRPLALSLYKRLITERVWAEGRGAMAYRMVEAPLLIDYFGRPYIDVRLSLNSFLPSDLDPAFAHRLVDHQLAMLVARPELHDKIEFEIAMTCYDFAFRHRLDDLRDAGFGADELSEFAQSVGRLTRDALIGGREAIDGLLAQTEFLETAETEKATGTQLDQARRMLASCMQFGTLPFATLARHGFIAVSFLRSLVERGVFGQDDSDRLIRGIRTVATDLVTDMRKAASGENSRAEFLAKYGHLRPGTYDVTSWRYDERPDLYLSSTGRDPVEETAPMNLSAVQRRDMAVLLEETGYAITPDALLDYMQAAIKAREQAKFAFTRSISDALCLLVEWAAGQGLSREDISFATIDELLAAPDPGRLAETIARAREAYTLTRAIRLPHIIREPADIDVVRVPMGQPTFITGRSVTAPARRLIMPATPDIDGHIILIESADPGFDWIFSHGIAGLITKYGGANSHMAIRSAEFGLPAAIGCGEQLFETLTGAAVIELNCATRKVTGH